MNRNENNTLDDILSAAKAEFSEKGFQSASLRRIVKNAGVTTGAFYGYFKRKEELFDALVGEQYDMLMGMFCETQNAFTRLSPKEQVQQMDELSGEGMKKMMDYCYANKDEFKLILCSSDGTKYENIIHDMAESKLTPRISLQKQWNSSAIRNTMLTKHLSIYWQADCFRHFLK